MYNVFKKLYKSTQIENENATAMKGDIRSLCGVVGTVSKYILYHFLIEADTK